MNMDDGEYWHHLGAEAFRQENILSLRNGISTYLPPKKTLIDYHSRHWEK